MNKNERIIEYLQTLDIPLYLVGGSMRDKIMGKEPSDLDLATPLLPDEVKDIFRTNVNEKQSENSTEFGTVFVNIFGETVEITTFRKDMSRGRHPDVKYTTSIREDSKRRDFTINSIYRDIRNHNYYDYHGGLEDINNRILRTVGKTRDRMTEDPLRILRAIRFHARGFEMDNELKCFMENENLRYFLREISAKRTREELLKILKSNPRKGLKIMKKLGVLEYIVRGSFKLYSFDQKRPEYHKWSLFNHSVLTAEYLWKNGADPELILIGFLHDIGKPGSWWLRRDYLKHSEIGTHSVEFVFNHLKFSNKSIKRAKTLVKYHMRLHQDHTKRNLRKTSYLVDPFQDDLVLLFKADLWGSRFETSDLHSLPVVEKLPIDGYDCLNILKEQGVHNPEVVGKMKEYARNWSFKHDWDRKTYLKNLRNLDLHNIEKRLNNEKI